MDKIYLYHIYTVFLVAMPMGIIASKGIFMCYNLSQYFFIFKVISFSTKKKKKNKNRRKWFSKLLGSESAFCITMKNVATLNENWKKK